VSEQSIDEERENYSRTLAFLTRLFMRSRRKSRYDAPCVRHITARYTALLINESPKQGARDNKQDPVAFADIQLPFFSFFSLSLSLFSPFSFSFLSLLFLFTQCD